jgi:hypothetical protein
MDSCVIKPAPLLALQPGCLHEVDAAAILEPGGKNVLLSIPYRAIYTKSVFLYKLYARTNKVYNLHHCSKMQAEGY